MNYALCLTYGLPKSIDSLSLPLKLVVDEGDGFVLLALKIVKLGN